MSSAEIGSPVRRHSPSEPYKSGVTPRRFSVRATSKNSFHFSSFILDTPYVFVCPLENKKSSGMSSISPRTRGSAALPFMRKISHPSLFFG